MAERGIHKTGTAIVVSQCPDVCLTKRGSSVVPVPYSIFAKFEEAQNTSRNVRFEGTAAFHCTSYLPNVVGNEAGNKGGVKSGVNLGIVNPSAKSSTLRINGNWAIRHDHVMKMNCEAQGSDGNTIGKTIYMKTKVTSKVDPTTREIVDIDDEEYIEGSEGSGVYYID